MIVADGVALALLFAMAGGVCVAVVHWRGRQRVRLLRVGQFADDEVCADHGRVGVSSSILYKDVVITELLGRGTFTLVHSAHLGYQEVVIKTLRGRGYNQGVVQHTGDVVQHMQEVLCNIQDMLGNVRDMLGNMGYNLLLCRQPLGTGAV